MARFGEKLRSLRQQHGMTMRQLADVLEYKSHGYLGDLESGRRQPSLELALNIADFFEVPLEQLARDELELDSDIG